MPTISPLGRFPGIADDGLSVEQKRALEQLQGGRGSIPAPYRYLIASPLVVQHLGELGTALRRDGEMTDRELEIVVLVTAHHLDTAFVQAAHRRLGMKAGLSDAVMDAILGGKAPQLEEPREAMVYRLSAALHHGGPVRADLAQQAEATLGRKMIAEIIALIGNYTATCLTMRFVDAKPSEISASA